MERDNGDVVLKLATAFVIQREAEELKTSIALYKALSKERPTEAAILLKEILKERDRVDPEGKWDEEEVMIANLELNKNRKKRKGGDNR